MTAGTSEHGMIPPEVVTLLPYTLAREFKAIAFEASGRQARVMMANASDGEAIQKLQEMTGLTIIPVETPEDRIADLLDKLSGSLEGHDLWLQRRHVQALSRLVDHSVNLGHLEGIRSLVDRAIEFAPYSAELWLMKARLATHRKDVIHALTIASQIAPNDRRVLRWIHSLQELDESPPQPVETPDPPSSIVRPRYTEQPPSTLEPVEEIAPPIETELSHGQAAPEFSEMPQVEPALSEPQPEAAPTMPEPESAVANTAALARSDSIGRDEAAFEAGRRLARTRDLQELLQVTGESLQEVAGADSVSVFFQTDEGWSGFTTHEELRDRLTRMLPRQSRLSSQAVRQALPIVIRDTVGRIDDVGPVIPEVGIRSFALLPIRTNGDIGGLAYLNYDQPDRADVIFEAGISRGIELIINCAGTSAGAIQHQDRLSESTTVDAATGAYSLVQFEKLLAAEIDRARRYRFTVAVLALDIDDFSRINETLGAEVADGVLRELVRRVEAMQRSSDVISRKGDDEFLLMLPQTTSKGASAVARRIHRAMEEAVVVGGRRCQPTLSIGVAGFPEHADDPGSIINAAEIALFGAKAQGKNRTSLADALTLAS